MNNPNQQPLHSDAVSVVYEGGNTFPGSPTHRSPNGMVTSLAQLVGRNDQLGQPEPLDSVKNALATVRGLYNVPGEHFIYYVRDNDIGTGADFSPNSQGKVKKIVTFPLIVTETTIIRTTVFKYQNQTYPTNVTSISEYEEAAGFYMTAGVLSYDVNSANQNRIVPNT